MAASTVKKNFIVTGGARGIGRGLARLLLQAGHRVLIVDNNDLELEWIREKMHSPDADFTHADLSDPASATHIADRARGFFNDSALDVLINNAADTSSVGASEPEDLRLADWNNTLAVNLTAPMLLAQKCLPLFRDRAAGTPDPGPSIVNISSTRALMSEPRNEPYAASKAGLLGLTQALAVSLAPRGIRVNAVLPGWIHVGNECRDADEEGRAWEQGLDLEDHAWHLTGRVGRVEDVFGAVMYLVENGGVTGSEVVVDGGVTRKMVYPEE